LSFRSTFPKNLLNLTSLDFLILYILLLYFDVVKKSYRRFILSFLELRFLEILFRSWTNFCENSSRRLSHDHAI